MTALYATAEFMKHKGDKHAVIGSVTSTQQLTTESGTGNVALRLAYRIENVHFS